MHLLVPAERVEESTVSAKSRPPIAPSTRDLLNRLRMIGLSCRCAAREDMFRACSELAFAPKKPTEAYASVLVRSLSQALGRMPRFFRPGVEEMSFDEEWLIRLMLCARSNDASSMAFLLRSRVPEHAQRNIGFLISAVSEHLEEV